MSVKLCDLGCGLEAKFYFKSSKRNCCSKNVSQCPEYKRKRKFKKYTKAQLTCDNCGRVCKTPQTLGQHRNWCKSGVLGKDGGYYYFLDLSGKKVFLHRHLMEVELGRKLNPGEVVHHKDGDKLNNSLDNLEVMSRSGHTRHHYDILVSDKKDSLVESLNSNRALGDRAGRSKLTEAQVVEIIKKNRLGASYAKLAEEFDVNPTTVSKICRRIFWKHVTIDD